MRNVLLALVSNKWARTAEFFHIYASWLRPGYFALIDNIFRSASVTYEQHLLTFYNLFTILTLDLGTYQFG